MTEEKEIDIFHVFLYLLNYVKRKLRTIIWSFLVGLILFISYHFIRDTQFSSTMSMTTNTMPYMLISEIGVPVQQGIAYNKDSLVSELLQLPLDVVKKIESFSIEEVKRHPADNREGTTVNVEFITTHPTIFSSLEQATLTYFNTNSFIKRITQTNQIKLEALLNETTIQISRLDSIQKLIPKVITQYPKSDKTMLSDFNLGTVYQQMIYLKMKESETIEKLDLIDEFKSISGFVIIKQTKGLFHYSLTGMLAGLLLNLLFFLIDGGQRLMQSKSE
jgi:hypothetical protein